jgi:large conductance mechanosensitive channel
MMLKNVLKGFGQFIMRGNVVDLAVAVVIGAAFNTVVSALVKDLITPFITAIAGQPDFSALTFTLHNSAFHYGDFINAIISFVLVAGAIYFCVVAPMNVIMTRFLPAKAAEAPALVPCPSCLSEVPAAATRCRSCTGPLTPIPASAIPTP